MNHKDFPVISRTVKELRKRLKENNFKPVKLTMKCNGDIVTLTPCMEYYSEEEIGFRSITYYLLESSSVQLCGGRSLLEVAEELVYYKYKCEANK